MRCYNPISIVNKEKSTRTNIVKDVVPCGQCVACTINISEDFAQRIQYELKSSINSFFITLTYDDKKVKIMDSRYKVEELKKEHFQNFMKKLRINFDRTGMKHNIRYFTVGEYGGQFGRPHFHSIMWNIPIKDQLLQKVLDKTWGFGFVDIREINAARIRYVTGYMIDRNKNAKIFKKTTEPFRLISKKLGIGYIEKRKEWHRKDLSRVYMVNAGGVRHRLPRYYAEKLYSKDERELQKEMLFDQNHEREHKKLGKYVKKSNPDYWKHIDELNKAWVDYERNEFNARENQRLKINSKQKIKRQKNEHI